VALQGRGVWPFPRLLAAAALSALAASSQAQVSGSLGLDSDYRYRGVSLSRSQPSVHASLNYDAPQRWYAGASATRAALTPAQTASQLSGYAGWSTATVDGRSLELGADGSHFAGVSGYDFAEAYAGVLSERWSARVYYAPDYYGRRMQTSYLELNAFPPLDRRIRLFAHAGALMPLAGASGDAARVRFDASAGAGVVRGRWDLHAAVFAATRGGPYPAVYDGRRAALVFGAAVSF
jgi:uncharacterized protein (TIGR02001 family)